MNREQRVLSAVMSSRHAWESVSGLMDEEDFSELAWLIICSITEYYTNDPHAGAVDKVFLIDALTRAYPRFVERFRSSIDELAPVSVPNILQEFRTLKMETAAQHLAASILANDQTGINSYFEKYSYYKDYATATDTDDVFVDADIEDILAVHKKENLIPIVPSELNDRLDGGVIPGTQIAVYAPTEVGKSLFAINMACGMLRNGKKVLYCGNEDPAKAMLLRFYACLSEMDKASMMAAPQRAKEIAYNNGFGNLIFFEMSPGNISEISRQVERHKPDIVFVDQMANMGTSANFTKTEKNEYLSVRLRELAKKHSIVTVILHQASDSAYGNLFVQKNDMYYSNVGVQGQMDVMIGIGMDAAYDQQNKRMICITKNKLSGNHDNFPINIDPSISKVYGG